VDANVFHKNGKAFACGMQFVKLVSTRLEPAKVVRAFTIHKQVVREETTAPPQFVVHSARLQKIKTNKRKLQRGRG